MDSVASRLGDLALALVRIPSETGAEARICSFVEARLRALPRFRVRRHRHSLLADLPPVAGLGPRPGVMLCGHLDTVPTFRDTEPRIEGGVLHGCGASDMKGALAVMLALAEDLAEVPLPFHLSLVFYEAEEGPIAGNGLVPLLEACVADLPRPDLAIAMEPTDGRIHLGCVGSLHARVTFRGRKAHAARPWQGENAITRAGEFLAAMHRLPPREVDVGGLTYREVQTVTLAEGGQGRNVVPDRFTLNVNVRFAPGGTAEQALERLRAQVGAEGEVELLDAAPAGPVCLSNPLYQRFQSVTGAEVEAKQAWTDVAQLGARGIDAVNFGPGLTAQAHQVGEHVPVLALARSYRSLREFLTTPF